jgi:hypothetical protein
MSTPARAPLAVPPVPLYGLHELAFEAREPAADPFGVALDVRFRDDAGRELLVPAYYDGGATYRARFSPPAPGRWRYAVDAAEGSARALAGPTEGEVHCVAAGTRGPLQRAAEPHHLVYASGERAVILGNTAYNLLACYRRAPDEARAFVAYYAERGFNWVRFFLEQTTWDSHGHVVWPWGGTPERPDFGTFDLDHFRAAEDVLRLLDAAGCTASVILLHPSDPVFRGRDDLVPPFRRYIRYAVARLGAFSNVVWNIANEWERERVLTTDDVEALGSYLAAVDPYQRLTAVHHYARFEFPEAPWVDVASMQHRGLPYEINRVAVANRCFGKPVLNEEYGYEADVLAPPNDPANVRRDHWALAMAGAYGTYGDKTKGSKVGAYFSATLEDSIDAVVPDALQHLPRLMARVPYWQMVPLNDLLSGCIREEVFCLARPGHEYLVYMAVGQNVGLDLSHVSGGALRGEWWNPRTGEVSTPFERPRFEGQRPRGSGAIRTPVVFTPPDYEHDWVLRVAAQEGS